MNFKKIIDDETSYGRDYHRNDKRIASTINLPMTSVIIDNVYSVEDDNKLELDDIKNNFIIGCSDVLDLHFQKSDVEIVRTIKQNKHHHPLDELDCTYYILFDLRKSDDYLINKHINFWSEWSRVRRIMVLSVNEMI